MQKELQIMHQTSKVNDIFTNLRHIITKTTSSIKVTPEPAPIAINRNYGSTLLCWTIIPHIFQTKFKKVKHATPRNK